MTFDKDQILTRLNRYLKNKKAIHNHDKLDINSRPNDCHDLQFAERFRIEISSDISQMVTNIHNKSLTDAEILDQNEKINKLIKEKENWEKDQDVKKNSHCSQKLNMNIIEEREKTHTKMSRIRT